MSDSNKLISAYFDGSITRDQFNQLIAWVNADRSNAREFARQSVDQRHVIDLLRSDVRDWQFIFESQHDHQPEITARNTGEVDLSLLEMNVDDFQSERIDFLFNEVELSRAARKKREAEVAHEKQQQIAREDERRESMRMLAGLSKQDAAPQTRHYVIPKPLFYGSITAMMVIAAAIIWSMLDRDMKQAESSDEIVEPWIHFVATLDSSVQAKWANDQSIADGQILPQGKYELESGLAKIVYDSGAEMIIEAPAAFTLDSKIQLSLRHGKVLGHCPTIESRGFTIIAPNALVKDLGTEFGVAVEQAGYSLVQVYDGEIELTGLANGAPATNPQSLTAGSAREIDRTGTQLQEIDLNPLAFVQDEEFDANVKAKESAYHRWLAYTYRMRRDSSILAYYSFSESAITQDVVRNEAHTQFDTALSAIPMNGNEAAAVQLSADRFGGMSAYRFNRHLNHQLVVNDWSEVTGELRELTVAAWVKTKADSGWHLLVTQWNGEAAVNDRYAFHLGIRAERFGTHADSGGTPVETAWPGIQAHIGSGSRFQFDALHEGRTGSSTRARDGWVHVAMTVASNGDLRLYRNGRLVDYRESEEENFRLAHVSQPLVLGGKAARNVPEKIHMQGMLDDVALISRALSALEIQEMYEAGRAD